MVGGGVQCVAANTERQGMGRALGSTLSREGWGIGWWESGGVGGGFGDEEEDWI